MSEHTTRARQRLRDSIVVRSKSASQRLHACSLLKNCVKVLIGRKTHFDDRDLFLQRYILHLIGLRPICNITCPGKGSEGAGSQALMIMNAINFARSFSITYVPTPFTLIHHAERPMQEMGHSLGKFFNLGAGEVTCDIKRYEVVNYCNNIRLLELCFRWCGREDELTNRFKALIPEFRRKYYLNKSPRTTDEVTVAVHIRRGDVPDTGSDSQAQK